MEMLKKIPEIDEKSVITVFYGESVDITEAKDLVESVNEEFPLVECGIIEGKQTIYDYYMAIE